VGRSFVQWVELALGLLLFYIAVFFYDDEFGRAKNKLIDWWVVVTETGERAVSRHAVFTSKLLRAVADGLTWLFGPRVISVRAVWVAVMLSTATFYCGAPILINLARALGVVAEPASPFGGTVLKMAAIGYTRHMVEEAFRYACLATIPAIWSSAIGWRRAVVTVGLCAFGASALRSCGIMIGAIMWTRQWFLFVFVVAVLIGAVWTLVFVGVWGWVMRRWGAVEDAWNGLVVLVATVIVGYALAMAPLYLGVYVISIHGFLGFATFVSALTNVVDLVLIGGVLACIALVLFHRVFWGALERPLAALYRVLPNRKALGALGCLALAGWDGRLWELIKKVVIAIVS
jgi:hypothetical protein